MTWKNDLVHYFVCDARIDFYLHHLNQERRINFNTSTATWTYYPAARYHCAYLGARSLGQLIWSIAKIGPAVIFDTCKSLYNGNFPEFTQSRMVAKQIITAPFKIALYIIGIISPKIINDLLMELGSKQIINGICRKEAQDVLAQALAQGYFGNHTIKHVISCVRESVEPPFTYHSHRYDLDYVVCRRYFKWPF